MRRRAPSEATRSLDGDGPHGGRGPGRVVGRRRYGRSTPTTRPRRPDGGLVRHTSATPARTAAGVGGPGPILQSQTTNRHLGPHQPTRSVGERVRLPVKRLRVRPVGHVDHALERRGLLHAIAAANHSAGHPRRVHRPVHAGVGGHRRRHHDPRSVHHRPPAVGLRVRGLPVRGGLPDPGAAGEHGQWPGRRCIHHPPRLRQCRLQHREAAGGHGAAQPPGNCEDDLRLPWPSPPPPPSPRSPAR
jgi:hypothetical protein